jgi:hypothetical protein
MTLLCDLWYTFLVTNIAFLRVLAFTFFNSYSRGAMDCAHYLCWPSIFYLMMTAKIDFRTAGLDDRSPVMTMFRG